MSRIAGACRRCDYANSCYIGACHGNDRNSCFALDSPYGFSTSLQCLLLGMGAFLNHARTSAPIVAIFSLMEHD